MEQEHSNASKHSKMRKEKERKKEGRKKEREREGGGGVGAVVGGGGEGKRDTNNDMAWVTWVIYHYRSIGANRLRVLVNRLSHDSIGA